MFFTRLTFDKIWQAVYKLTCTVKSHNTSVDKILKHHMELKRIEFITVMESELLRYAK